VGFAPQLTLQAAIALHGEFDVAGEFETVSGLYVKLGGSSGGFARPVDFSKKDMDFQHRSESHYQDLIDLLNQFRDPQTPYPPRPFPKFAKRTSAYDHLARVKEWSRGGNEENGT
ncbi:MAG: double-strand break repair protein AddB, partial [Alphaproteobacteria bacterium]|nr:double-strand break repair protein AddB [Alphaproteobacteria bacterium]